MFGLGLPEIIIIVLILGILFFGSKKITDFARSIGRASGEFKKGKKEIEEELKLGEKEADSDKNSKS
ncbi:MAG: twin-arginine translocase TatA/TatE family subunit [bacterium]|nr:twin-arginine translocase TatA/TatE family subunit [bacterium]